MYTAERRDSKCLGLIFVIFTRTVSELEYFRNAFVGCLQVDALSHKVVTWGPNIF